MTKDELLNRIKVERRQLERYLFYFEKDTQGKFIPSRRLKLSSEDMQEAGVYENWSLKDLLAHLSGWQTYFLDTYHLVHSEKDMAEFTSISSTSDEAAITRSIYIKNKDRSIEEVLADFRTAHQRVIDHLESISEEEFSSAERYEWAGQKNLMEFASAVTWEHYRWAKVHIRKWVRTRTKRSQGKDSIIQSIQTQRRRLEKNLAGLSQSEMTQPGVIGDWSIKDILAHLVDWEQRFLGWYQAGVRGEVPQTPAPGMTWSELDQLNQMIYEENKDRSLSSVLKDFDNSYQQVMDTIKSIPEEEIFSVGLYAWTGKGNLASYILANTANHYRWAKTQIRKWKRKRSEN